MELATDFNPGTSPITSLRMMMNMGCTLFRLTPEEALKGVTCNAEQALGLSSMIGQIKVGYQADFAIWEIETPAQLSNEMGTKLLHCRVLNGRIC